MRPPLRNGLRIYAIGDVHGCARTLDALGERIAQDIAARPVAEVLEIFLGDYVDRGADTAGVIERVAADVPGRTRVRLMGNHEDAMLDALNDGTRMARWLAFGGEATLRSYGIEPREHAHDSQSLQPLARSVIPEAHVTFLENLSLRHEEPGYLFVHAGIRPGVPLAEQEAQDLLWIREEFYEAKDPLPAFVVHGHTPVNEPEILPHRANIDTGAVYGNALSALVLEGEELRVLSAPLAD